MSSNILANNTVLNVDKQFVGEAGPSKISEEITYPTGHPLDEADSRTLHQRHAVLSHSSSFFFISNKFESLDYIKIINQLEVEKGKTQSFCSLMVEDSLRVFYFLLTGVGVGLVGVFVEYGVLSLGNLKYSYLGSYIDEHWAGSGAELALMTVLWFLGVIIPVMAGSLLVVFIAPFAAGGGVAQCVAYLNGVRVPKVLSVKALVVKVLSTICCVISGLAGGKEGPMMHMGAIVGGGLPSALPWQVFKSDHERRDLAAAGFGAGIAVAFGAPIGGLLLALEEGISFWDISLMWKCYLCVVMAYFFGTLILSILEGLPGKISDPKLLTLGTITKNVTDYEIFEFALFAIVAVIGGLMAAIIIKIHVYITVFRRRFVQTKVRKLTESFVTACVVATLSLSAVMFVRKCSNATQLDDNDEINTTSHTHQLYCNKGEYSDMSLLYFQTQEGVIHTMFGQDSIHILPLAVFCVIYLLLICLTMGLSISAGIFVPQIVFGAAWGRLFGTLLHQLLPHAEWARPAKYAYLGATAQLSGTVGKTFSILIIMVEASASISFSFPLMVVVSIAKCVVNTFVMPIYETQIHVMGMPILPSQPPPLSAEILTSAVMSPAPLVTLPLAPTVGTIMNTLQACCHNGFPIIGKAKSGKSDLLGLVLRQQLLVLLKYKAYKYPAPRPQQMSQCRDVLLKEARRQIKLESIVVDPENLSHVIDLNPYYNPHPYTVRETLPLTNTYSLFRSLGLRHIIVVNDNNEAIAMITRKDLAKFHAWESLCRMGVKQMLIKP